MDALTAWNEGSATLRPAIPAPSLASSSGGSLSSALGSNGQSGSRSASPLEALKGGQTPGDQLHGGPDESKNPLTTGTPDVSIQPGILQPGSNPTASDTSADKPTPLEKLKGGNQDVQSGDLTTGKPKVVDKQGDALLKGGSPATQSPAASTPLENVKGGNQGVSAGDLTTGKADFSQDKEGVLTSISPATQKPASTATPLEKVKGANRDVGAGDLTTGKVDFSQSKEGLLTSKSPATQTPGTEAPLENVKGGKSDVKAGDLATGKVKFEPNEQKSVLQPNSDATTLSSKAPQADVSKIGSGSPSVHAPGQATPLENVKGGNRDVGVGDLATGPANFKAAPQEPALQGSSPTATGTSPLESLKGKLATQPGCEMQFVNQHPRVIRTVSFSPYIRG